MSALQYYQSSILSRDLILKLSLANISQLPKLDRISIATTSRYVGADRKQILPRFLAFYLMTGQKPSLLRAKKSVASFQVKAGSLIGCQVSLLQRNMWNFLEHLVHSILPQSKNFTAFQHHPTSVNLHFGFKHFLFFPELEKKYELFEFLSGCDLILTLRSRTAQETVCFLSGLQLPCKL